MVYIYYKHPKTFIDETIFLPVLSSNNDVSKWGQSISKQLHNSLKALNPFWANKSTKISPRSVGFFSLTSDLSSSTVITCLFTKWCKTGETDGSNNRKGNLQYSIQGTSCLWKSPKKRVDYRLVRRIEKRYCKWDETGMKLEGVSTKFVRPL